jgi:hypothetical protein
LPLMTNLFIVTGNRPGARRPSRRLRRHWQWPWPPRHRAGLFQRHQFTAATVDALGTSGALTARRFHWSEARCPRRLDQRHSTSRRIPTDGLCSREIGRNDRKPAPPSPRRDAYHFRPERSERAKCLWSPRTAGSAYTIGPVSVSLALLGAYGAEVERRGASQR